MRGVRAATGVGLLLVAVVFCGCKVVSRSQWNALRVQNAQLLKLKEAQEARIANLQTHCRRIEDQLMRAEEDLALLEEQYGLQGKRLANYRQQRDLLRQQVLGTAPWPEGVPPEIGARLAQISRQFPSLRFDPQTGVSKLDTDILFDFGSAELKPEAEDLLRQLAEVLKTPEASDLRVLVAGHTDDKPVARKPARDLFRNNFHLSSARALAVCEKLVEFGVDDSRIAIAGFGPHQPIAPNVTAADRRKNRRVEIFVLAPQVPVIGWTETIPTVYR